jgi:3',5'-nucleoside bisphosphate phosphatase
VPDRPIADRATSVDLHLHSRFSDGDDTPEQLAVRCAEAGLRVVSCTDHDTVAGVAAFAAAAGAAGIRAVPGAELTVRWHDRETHLLAYFADPADPVLRDRIDAVRAADRRWWFAWFEQAARLGVPTSGAAAAAHFGADRVAYLGDYLDFFLDAAVGDPRFAAYPRGRHDEFRRDWCRAGRPLHRPWPARPGLAEAAGWVAEAGGVTVLAHPGRAVPAADAPARFAELRALGVAGAEVWTTWHQPAEIELFAALCARYDLVATVGSDYHGARLKPWAPAPGLVPVAPPDALGLVGALEARLPGR